LVTILVLFSTCTLRNVLSLKPTIVSICFGMNDGGYREFDNAFYHVRWRQVSLMGLPRECQPELDTLLKKLDDMLSARETARIKAAATDRAWEWALTLQK